jgi:hypothetical protein
MQAMQTIPYHGLVLLFVMLTALWCGAVNFRLKMHYRLLRPNKLPCLMPFVIPFQSRTLSKRLAAFFCCQILSQISASQFMRTIFLLHRAQTYCNQISSLLQQCSNILQQIRQYQAQVYFNNTATCRHLH